MRRLIIISLFLFTSSRCWASPLVFEQSYPTFEGQAVNLNTLIGKQPVYLKFWASWCLDCRRELPSLEKAYQQYHKNIAMFAVNLNINETDEAISTLKQKSGLTMPIILDQHGSIASHFDFKGTPFHVLINAQGEVVYTTYRNDGRLAQKLDELANNSANIKIENPQKTATKLTTSTMTEGNHGLQILYFTAVWCDSYMQEVDANIAENCINGNQIVDKLYRSNSQLPLQVYVTHLWTEPKDVVDYQQRLGIPYSINIDAGNKLFQQYKANGYPTLIVIKNDHEILRLTNFSDAEQVLKKLQKAIVQ